MRVLAFVCLPAAFLLFVVTQLQLDQARRDLLISRAQTKEALGYGKEAVAIAREGCK